MSHDNHGIDMSLRVTWSGLLGNGHMDLAPAVLVRLFVTSAIALGSSAAIAQDLPVPPAPEVQLDVIDPPVIEEQGDVPLAESSNDPDMQGSLSRTVSFGRDRQVEIQLRGAHAAFAAGKSVEGVRVLVDLLALSEPHMIQVGSTLRDARDEATRLLRWGTDQQRDQFWRATEIRANQELQDAVSASDLVALAGLAARYPFTPVARECVEILATQFSDHGRFDAAVMAVERWIEWSPDPIRTAQSSPRMVELWVSSLLELGAVDKAADVAARYRAASPVIKVPGSLLTDSSEGGSHPAETWTVESEFSPAATNLLRQVLNDLARQGGQPSLAVRPLILADRILWRSLTEIVCIQRATGKVLWRKPIPDPLVDDLKKMGERADPNLVRRLRMQLSHRLLRNTIQGQLTCDAQRVYCIEQVPASQQKPVGTEQIPNNLPRVAEALPFVEQTVAAYSLDDGSKQWKSHEVWGDHLRGVFLFGPPTPYMKDLYCVIQEGGQLRLLRMNSATGVSDGASLLGDAPLLNLDLRRTSQACPIVWNQGLAICATGAGAVAAFDVFSGQLKWGYRHARDDVEAAPGLLLPPVDRNGWTWLSGWQEPQLLQLGSSLIYASPESRQLRCLQVDTGELLWEVPIADGRILVGGNDQRVVIAGEKVVRSVRLENGSTEQEYRPSSRLVSVTWRGATCRLTMRDGEQIDWNSVSDKVETIETRAAPPAALWRVGTLQPIQGPAEGSLIRTQPLGASTLVTGVSQITLRPAEKVPKNAPHSILLPRDLAEQGDRPHDWIKAVGEWIQAAPEADRPVRVQAVLAELSLALSRSDQAEWPLDGVVEAWGLTSDQRRELSLRRLQRAMRMTDPTSAVEYVLQLLELQPEDWEVDSLTTRWGTTSDDSPIEMPRTIRLDAALRGILQEIWDHSAPEQRVRIQARVQEWSALPRNQLERWDRAVEVLHFLSPFPELRPLEWKTLGELAVQQLRLHRQATLADAPSAAVALWRLAELHMARGDWGDAAGRIEQLQQRFDSVAVRGDQTARQIMQSMPQDSPVLRRIDSDRRTVWPERQPVVTSKESYRASESQIPIPIRADRGSLFDHLNVTFARTGNTQLRFAGLGKEKPWTLTLPSSSRSMRQQNPELRRGWAFGQFLVVQVGTELFCVSSLNSKGETTTSKKQEMILWPSSAKRDQIVMVDTLGNEENALLSHEHRLVPQFVGFIRPESELFDAYGHRAAWVGPVNAGTLCFLQQGMLVCLETATGRELWRRYDMPSEVRVWGDDGELFLLHDRQSTIEHISPLDGRTLRIETTEVRPDQWLKNWGRKALAATGQPPRGTVFGSTPQPEGTEKPKDTPQYIPQELQLQMVDLSGPKTLWTRTYPAGSAAFEIDEDWLGVLTSTGQLLFLDILTGEVVRESKVEVPAGLSQIVTSVTERSIYVSLSSPVTENRLLRATTTPLRWRQFYVNGPLHAFDRRSGEYQWSQRVENRILPLDQVRDVPLLLCVDVWQGSAEKPAADHAEEAPTEGANPPASTNTVPQTRYWALDSRTGQVVLDLSINNHTSPEYTIERNLTKGWVDLRLGSLHGDHRFEYAPQ